MYLIKTEIKESSINEKGVFSLETVKKGTIVWKFISKVDHKITTKEYDQLSHDRRLYIEKVGYLSPVSNMWIYPNVNDNAKFTNHSNQNNLTAITDLDFSDEIYFISNKDINVGDELTNNYLEFDKFIQSLKPEWVN